MEISEGKNKNKNDDPTFFKQLEKLTKTSGSTINDNNNYYYYYKLTLVLKENEWRGKLKYSTSLITLS